MITTTQVRSIMKKNGILFNQCYTNKTTGETGKARRVKAYFRGDQNSKVYKELVKAAGKTNVKILDNFYPSGYNGIQSLIVRCELG